MTTSSATAAATLQPVADALNLLTTQSNDATCCGGGCCATN